MPNPRLNLSCFHKNGNPPRKNLLRRPAGATSERPSLPLQSPKQVSQQGTSKEKPVFIPVGFHRSRLKARLDKDRKPNKSSFLIWHMRSQNQLIEAFRYRRNGEDFFLVNGDR